MWSRILYRSCKGGRGVFRGGERLPPPSLCHSPPPPLAEFHNTALAGEYGVVNDQVGEGRG